MISVIIEDDRYAKISIHKSYKMYYQNITNILYDKPTPDNDMILFRKNIDDISSIFYTFLNTDIDTIYANQESFRQFPNYMNSQNYSTLYGYPVKEIDIDINDGNPYLEYYNFYIKPKNISETEFLNIIKEK